MDIYSAHCSTSDSDEDQITWPINAVIHLVPKGLHTFFLQMYYRSETFSSSPYWQQAFTY